MDMDRTATCHCGQLKVIASGEPHQSHYAHEELKATSYGKQEE
jgi:hypothetical protein